MKCIVSIFIGLIIVLQNTFAETFFKQESIPVGIQGVQALYYGDKAKHSPILFGASGGVYRATGKDDKWNRILRFNSLEETALKIVVNDSETQALVVTSESAYLSNSKFTKWKKIFGSDLESNEQLHDGVLSRNQIGSVFIASTKGLYFSENEGKSWQYVEFSESDTIYQIHESSEGCWLTTESGIYQFSAATHQISSAVTFQYRSADSNGGLGNSYMGVESQLLVNPKRTWVPSGADQTIGYLDIGSSSGMSNNKDDLFQVRSPAPRSSVEPVSVDEWHVLYSRANKLYLLNTETGQEKYLSVAPGSGAIRDLDYQARNDTLYVGADGGMYVHENFAATQLLLNAGPLQYSPEHEVLEDLFAGEPTIHQVQVAAMRYAEVHPEKITKWRQQAAQAPWLPQISVGFDYGVDQVIELDRGGTNDPDQFISGPDEKDFNYDVQFTWSLSELIWNPDQTSIDNRSKLMVQLREDLMSRVNASYFARRLLILEGVMDTKRNPLQSAKKVLQIQELEAELDAVTGGYFTDQIYKGS